jgi:putative ABC transport system permease protein
MTRFIADIRIAVRALRKARGFTVMAVATLGLGIALSTIAIVVVNAYLLTDLPYPAADRLYRIGYGTTGQPQPRGMESLDWRSLDDVIEHQVAWDLDMFYLLGGEHAETAPGAWITRGFAEALGVQPALGRGFDESAFAPGGENVVMISHQLWGARFGRDPNIIGRTFTAYVSDRPDEAERFSIIGVLPPHFWHLNPYTDIFAPLRAQTYPYMTRLRPGVAPAAVGARMTALVRAGATGVPEDWAVNVVPAHDAHVTSVRPMLRTVSVAALLVLLVACANVAGLLLVRATRRHREVAVRSALGASRGALARMLMAEGLVIAGAATVLALVTTKLVVGSLAPLVQQQLGRSAPGGLAAFAIDWRVLAFAVATGTAIAVLCTIVPLAASLRPQLVAALQAANRSATEGRRSQRTRAGLVVLEIAASLALLVGSAVMLKSVVALLRTDLGFSADHVMNASLTLRQGRYPDAASRAAVFDRIVGRVGAVPGVTAIGLTTAWPLQQPRSVSIETVDLPARAITAAGHSVSEQYFTAIGISVIEGRAFQRSERIGSEPVAIVSQSLARRLWPDGSAVGRRISVPQSQERGDPLVVQRTVVGVAADVRQDPSDADRADIYLPMRQVPTRFTFLLIRTTGETAAALPGIRAAMRDVDPEFAVHRPRPLQEIVDEATARPRFMASLLASFALVAATLALVGVYGVIAYAVRQREREIAVRVAIGADPSRIVRLFVRQGGVILLVGLAGGVLTALGAARVIESQLFGVNARDPLAFAVALAAFASAGLLAIWWPARRAAATDPAIALRSE